MSRTEEFGAESRGQTFLYKTSKLTIVQDDKHPLWDPTAADPPPKWLVNAIELEERVLTPILVRKNGMRRGRPVIEVIDGRSRVKAVAEVNKRRKSQGLPELLVPAVYHRLDDSASMDAMIVGNELRKTEDHVTRAKRLERWLKINGGDEKRARVVFGLSNYDFATLLTVLEMDPQLREALGKKEVTLQIAKRLSDLPRDKQRAALAEILEGGKARGKAARKKADEKAAGARPRARSRRQMIKAVDTVTCMPDSEYKRGVLTALEWALGEADANWGSDG